MRLLVCGGRAYSNVARLNVILNRVHRERGVDVLIHGAAAGADSLADEWACRNGITVERYPANWKLHGRAAGPIRNQHMLKASKPDGGVAFPGGRGTADMVKRLQDAGIPVWFIDRESAT